jgi:hypothetical protein
MKWSACVTIMHCEKSGSSAPLARRSNWIKNEHVYWKGIIEHLLAAASLKFISCLFADDVECLLVNAKSEEGGMAHLRLTRPLGEFHLAH